MPIRFIRKISCAALLLIGCNVISAQDGAYSSYSPYSIFGMGDIYRQGTAYNLSMGGVGIASRSHKFINYINPAAITARDTLSFMMDFGLQGEGKLYRQGSVKSASNLMNISNVALTVPIYRKSAVVAGISPYSSTGYDFSHDITDPSLIGHVGNINYRSYGDGGLYQVFVGGAATFWNRLSAGAQFLYYFGNIDKSTIMNFSESSYRDVYSGYTMSLNAIGGNFGLQYEQALPSGLSLTVGATYKTSSRLKGYITDYKYATVSSVTDTLKYVTDTLSHGSNVRMASEYGVGISLRKGDRWRAEFDYTRSDWRNSNLENVTGLANVGESRFSTTYSQSFRAGFEIVPNPNDIRYYMRRCSYRGGIYYNRDYYKLDGRDVSSFGITFGMTFPVFRWFNGVSVGVDLGQRGVDSGTMIRERYAKIFIGFNIHDIWFQKPKYE